MPEEGSTLAYQNCNGSMRVPFIVYADFESFIKPIDTCQPNPENSYTKQYQKHTSSRALMIIIVYSQPPVAYTAETKDEIWKEDVKM